MTMINRAIAEKNADTNRLYATGYSNGGGGTWSLLSRNRGRFAAAIAVAGIIPAPGFNPGNLLGTAILAAHARDDATVPVARTRTVVDGILSAARQPMPNYAAAGSGLYYVVSNPEVAFHREVVASEPPGSTINYFISRTHLDLMYYEQPDGGHTVYSAFFTPRPFTTGYLVTLSLRQTHGINLGRERFFDNGDTLAASSVGIVALRMAVCGGLSVP